MAPLPAPDWPRLPGYRIVGELGRGGMGVVYLADELELGRPVALKMILTGSQADARELTRFKAEAEAVARLQHPNVVQIHAVGQFEGRPYLALEFCAGGSLEWWLNGKPLPPFRAAALVETLARAVQHAHERGIVHRDLKPANILLAFSDASQKRPGEQRFCEASLTGCVPKISDFGLAKRLDLPPGPTPTSAVLGTPSYMAPEQARRSSQPADARVDVWALGAILYELVTGRPPFLGDSVLDTLQQVARDEPVAPARLQPGCPRDLETIILKCLRKDPQRRYARALDLAEDCAAFQRGEPIRARATPSWERAAKWARRRPAAATLLAVCLLAIAGLVALGVWHTGELRATAAQARAQEKAALETAQLSRSRVEAQALLLTARERYGRGDWENARLRAVEALALLDTRPELADLTRQAEHLNLDCQRRLAERASRQEAQRRYQRFLEQRNEALFHATLFTGLDLKTNLARTQAAARAALCQFEVSDVPSGPPALPASGLSEQQRAEAVAGCYELLLVLAEAVAHPLPGEPARQRRRRVAEAVATLEGAGRLGQAPTKAYHLRLAHHLEQLGRKAEAVSHRARADALAPASACDYFLSGDIRRVRGELAQACRDFESALALQPNHFWAQYSFAFCCLRLGRLAEAKAGLTACLGHRRDFAWLYALRGFLHAELGEFAAAELDFTRALTPKPDDTTRYAVYANRGVLRVQQARAVEGLAVLQPLGGWLPLCALYGGVGQVQRARRLAEAVADLRTAVQLKPGNYQAHVSLAQAYAGQGRTEEARDEFSEAIRCQKELPDLYRTRADFSWRSGDLAAARRDLRRALALDAPTSRAAADDHVKLGQLLQRQQQYEAAVREYALALKIRPDHAGALRLRAVAMLELRRYGDAVRALDGYLARVEGGRNPRLAEAYRLRGLTRTQLGDHNGALHDYTRSLDVEADAATRRYRGWIYLVSGAPKLALADFEEALRLGDRDGDAYNGRGIARAKLRDYGAAVRDAREALRRGPRTVRLLHNAAAIYAQASAAGVRQTQYQQLALDLLGEALADLPAKERLRYWRKRISTDADLASLRSLPGYARLAP
jgi:tetratricopeptide (TPR) repeat protein